MSTKKRDRKILLVQVNKAVQAITTYCLKQNTSVTKFRKTGGPVDRATEDADNLAEVLCDLNHKSWVTAIELLQDFELDYGPITQFNNVIATVSQDDGKELLLDIKVDYEKQFGEDFESFLEFLAKLRGDANV